MFSLRSPYGSVYNSAPSSIGVATGTHFTLFAHEDEKGSRNPEKNNFLVFVKGEAEPIRVARIVRHGEKVSENDIKAWMEDDGRSTAKGMKAIHTGEQSDFIRSELDTSSKKGRFRANLDRRQRRPW